MAVCEILGLGIVVVALEVPSSDVVGVAVVIVVEPAARQALQRLAIRDLAVPEGGDEVLRRQVRRPLSLHADGVEVLMLSVGEAVAAGALDVDGKPAIACDRCVGGDSDRAWWIDTRVVDVVAQVQASVAVEVVAARPRQAAAVGALRTRQLTLVEPLVVERVLHVVGAVVDAALDVRDENVVATDVGSARVRPGAGEVRPRHVVGIERARRPAGQSTVGMGQAVGTGVLAVAQRAEHVELVVVGAAGHVAIRDEGGGVLARGEFRVVGRCLGPRRMGDERRGQDQREQEHDRYEDSNSPGHALSPSPPSHRRSIRR